MLPAETPQYHYLFTFKPKNRCAGEHDDPTDYQDKREEEKPQEHTYAGTRPHHTKPKGDANPPPSFESLSQPLLVLDTHCGRKPEQKATKRRVVVSVLVSRVEVVYGGAFAPRPAPIDTGEPYEAVNCCKQHRENRHRIFFSPPLGSGKPTKHNMACPGQCLGDFDVIRCATSWPFMLDRE